MELVNSMRVKSEKGALSKAELNSFCRSEIFRRNIYLTYISLGIVGIFLLASTYIYIIHDSLWFFMSWRPLAGVICCWWIFLHWYWPVSGKFTNLSERSLLPATFDISDEFFIYRSDDGCVQKIPMSSFYEIVKTNDYIALWENPYSVHLIPLRLFCEEDKGILRDLVQQRKS